MAGVRLQLVLRRVGCRQGLHVRRLPSSGQGLARHHHARPRSSGQATDHDSPPPPPPSPPPLLGHPLAERLNLRRLPDDLRYSVGYGHQEASGKIRYTGRPRGLVSNPSILAPTNGPGHHCCGDHFGRCGGAHSLLGFSDAF